jgi:hypothetical protein
VIFLGLIRSTEPRSLISARHSFSPSCRLRKMQPSILTPTSMTRDATPKPELLSARR